MNIITVARESEAETITVKNARINLVWVLSKWLLVLPKWFCIDLYFMPKAFYQ